MLPTIHIISPMGPSDKLPFFGAFVPVISRSLRANHWNVNECAVVHAHSLSIYSKIFRHFTLAYKLLKLSFRRPRIVYIHSPAWFSMIILAIFPKNSFYIINVHGSEIHGRSRGANIFWPFARKLINRSDIIVSPSKSFIEKVIHSTSADKCKFISSPSGGYEESTFYYSPKASNNPVIGYVSRIVKKKGWRNFLLVYDLLKIKYPNLKAIIIGEGHERSDLELELAKRNDKDISYLGAQPQKNLQQYYSQMSVFVFTSEITGVDTLGLVSIEAQACGTPVVATDSGITEEYIEDGINGFLAKPQDVEDFAKKIEICFEWDHSKRKLIAENAKNFENVQVGKNLTLSILEFAKKNGKFDQYFSQSK